MNLPNLLTISRVLLTPLLVILLDMDAWGAALAVFVAAMATDALDGYLARSRGLVTDFGKLMDPVADKLLIGAAFVCLAAIDRIDAWIVGLILAREVAVSGLRLAARREGLIISANRLGKAKTALQTITVVVLIVVAPDTAWVGALVAATTTITIMSGIVYAANYLGSRRAPASRAASAAPLA